MKADELSDLTKEPLLAYLLIKSGYASERWREAAANRNRIYEAIFDKIWDRERTKETRTNLNDIGKVGFLALMQSLGLAAWRGGGRTGDEATFTSIRDIFVRPDLLQQAKASGLADLNNIAVLFYTQKDEAGGRGYEFLHKSFGEYLTACGLFDAFLRWGRQVENSEIDFDHADFLRRWLILCGPALITADIAMFLKNEAELRVSEANASHTWATGRRWVRIAEGLFNTALADGVPAHETARTWREAEASALNAEKALIVLLNACVDVGYPASLLNGDPASGGWHAGPVNLPHLKKNQRAFSELLRRFGVDDLNYSMYFGPDEDQHFRDFSRFDLDGALVRAGGEMDFFGASLNSIEMDGVVAYGARFSGAQMQAAQLAHSNLRGCDFSGADLKGAVLINAGLQDSSLRDADLSSADLSRASLDYADFQGAQLAGARIVQASVINTNFVGSNFHDADLEGTKLADILPAGEDLEEARRKRDQQAREAYQNNLSPPTNPPP